MINYRADFRVLVARSLKNSQIFETSPLKSKTNTKESTAPAMLTPSLSSAFGMRRGAWRIARFNCVSGVYVIRSRAASASYALTQSFAAQRLIK